MIRYWCIWDLNWMLLFFFLFKDMMIFGRGRCRKVLSSDSIQSIWCDQSMWLELPAGDISLQVTTNHTMVELGQFSYPRTQVGFDRDWILRFWIEIGIKGNALKFHNWFAQKIYWKWNHLFLDHNRKTIQDFEPSWHYGTIFQVSSAKPWLTVWQFPAVRLLFTNS